MAPCRPSSPASCPKADDELTLLLGVGGDTIGDVRILPDGAPPKTTPPRLQVESFDRVSFTELMAQTGIRIDRVGLPGVQDKVSAAMLNLPVATTESQILLKLNPPEFRHFVEDEQFFLDAAAASGIRTVQARLVRDREDLPGLAVSRFDRVRNGDAKLSLAVEDGCQSPGLHPEAKYRISLEQLFTRLCSLCEAPVPAAAEFLTQATFAYVTGNGDAHAKNFSILQDKTGRWQPTPAYDLPSSQPYGDTTMALTLGGRRDGNLTGARFVALGKTIPSQRHRDRERRASSDDRVLPNQVRADSRVLHPEGLRDCGSQRRRGRTMMGRLLRGLGALLVMLAGLTAIPYALWALRGNPLSQRVSLSAVVEALTSRDDGQLLIG